MRTPRRHSRGHGPAALARAATLALIALLAGAFVVADPVRGAGESLVRAAASAWHGVLGDRPEPAATQRMIVLLAAASLADRMAAAEASGAATTPEDQKRWAAEADASQRLVLARLRSRGLELERKLSFVRTVNGFSALVDSRARDELERTPGVAGVYPVRTLYPAAITARTLRRPEFRAGAGRRPDVSLSGFDGRGLTIALLDSGVDQDHPYLHGRVLAGLDVVAEDGRAAAEAKPDEPTRVESHGTRMAGILVGSDGPGGLRGVVPEARILPLRVLGWERTTEGSFAQLGRGDGLIAGLERAVDPDGDGDVEDAARVALAAVVEPYASFPDSPETRAVAGATRLGTLVVAPAGNDGRSGGGGFGTVGAPGGSAAALTVGALDARRELLEAHLMIRTGGASYGDEARVLGAVPPAGALPVVGLLGPSLTDSRRRPAAVVDGSVLADFFDPGGVSRVAGRAVLLPAAGGALELKVRNAATAGAGAVLVYGAAPPAGAIDLEEPSGVPVIAVPVRAGRPALDALVDGETVSVTVDRVVRIRNEAADRVAPFSSGGIAYDGRVKPDLVAPGVGLATADAGTNADGSTRFATATGTSAAAAIVAGAAAAIAQARPGLTAAELRSVLVTSARRLVHDGAPEPVTLQGAGALDVGAAAAAEIAIEPAGLAFGRAEGSLWRVEQRVTVRNLSARRLEIGFAVTRDEWGRPELDFAAGPAHLSLAAGASADVTLAASGDTLLAGRAAGAFVVSPQGSRPALLPWAVEFRPAGVAPLLADVALSRQAFSPSDAAPAVLAFRAGEVAADRNGDSLAPVQLLVAELWTAGGKRLGVLTRLRDLLPGRYAFGITGRGPHGNVLRAGDYLVRLRARPVGGDRDARASIVDVPFTIRR